MTERLKHRDFTPNRSFQTDANRISHRAPQPEGRQLDGGMRAMLEPRFGHDFSKVRIHSDERAAQAASAFGALAFTFGNEIAFAPGEYDPQSPFGLRVLAHELAHVVQFERFGGDFARLEPQSRHGDTAETEAHAAATHALGGLNVQINAALSGAVSTWPDWLDDAASTVGGAVSGAVDTVTDTASSAYNTASNAVSSATDWAGEKAHDAQAAAKSAVSWAGDKVNDAENWVGNKASDAAKWAGHKYDAGKKAVGDAASWAGGKVNDAEKWLGKQAHDASDWASKKWNAGEKWAGEKYNDAKGWLGDYGKGIGQEGLGGLFDPSGAVDRQRSQRELADRFTVLGEGETAPAGAASNVVSQEEYQKIARMYSDIRRGRGDLTIDTGSIDGKDAAAKYGMTADAYKQGALNDVVSLMQTKSGRHEIEHLHDNPLANDDGSARDGWWGIGQTHHHTTIKPLLTNDDPSTPGVDEGGKMDRTNGYASPVGGDPNRAVNADGTLGARGAGSNVDILYNPGVNVGDAFSSFKPGSPWLSGFRSDVILAHEMNHAINQTQGTLDPRAVGATDNAANATDPDMAWDASYRDKNGNPLLRREHQAVGIGKYAGTDMTENAYRAERKDMADKGAVGQLSTDGSLGQRTTYVPRSGPAAPAPGGSSGPAAPVIPWEDHDD